MDPQIKFGAGSESPVSAGPVSTWSSQGRRAEVQTEVQDDSGKRAAIEWHFELKSAKILLIWNNII